jgi:uncharacterized protein (DUF58 family)
MKVTTRGRAVLSTAVALIFGALLFQDLLILTAFLILVAAAIGDVIWLWAVIRRPTKYFSVYGKEAPGESVSVSNVLHPGESRHDDLYFAKRIGGEATLLSRIPFLKLSPNRLKGRGATSEVGADFRTPFAGRYSSDTFEFGVTGPLRIVSATCAIPGKVTYSVFPHALEVALTSSRLLGRAGIGDSPVERPGVGTEFYGLRKYQPGDYYRQINWKATARRGELITNERMREAGGSFYLILEAVSPDYFDRDRLATTFLGIANALTMRGTRFGVLIHDGDRVIRLKKVDAPAASLAFSLKATLEFAELGQEPFEDELAAASSYALRPVRKLLADSGHALLSQVEDFAILEKRAVVEGQNLPKTIMEVVRENADNPPAILYVSGTFGPIEHVIELGLEIKRTYGVDFVVANPTAPWVADPDEDSAYHSYSRYSKKIKALRNAGVDYQVGEPSSLIQRLLSA